LIVVVALLDAPLEPELPELDPVDPVEPPDEAGGFSAFNNPVSAALDICAL
jgi:hypothetical protein